MLHTKIIDTEKAKIEISNAEKFIASSKFGASIFFTGTVRDFNENKKVTGITYDSHDAMVIKSFKDILLMTLGVLPLIQLGVHWMFVYQKKMEILLKWAAWLIKWMRPQNLIFMQIQRMKKQLFGIVEEIY